MAQFTHPGDFCPNPDCVDYGQVQGDQQRNLQKFGKTRKGVQRYRCKTCGRTFTATFGTIFYGKRTPEHEILETLALLAEGNRFSTLARVKGHKEDTILRWLCEAARHAAQVEEVLMAEFQVQCAQLDALWTYVGHKGEKKRPEIADRGTFWRATRNDMDSRLRAARGIAKHETQASEGVFRILKRRGHPDSPPPTISDGWDGGLADAMVTVYGCVTEYQGRGPPTKPEETGSRLDVPPNGQDTG